MKSPCLQCKTRSAACHSTCTTYADYREVWKDVRKARRDDYIGCCADASKVIKKKGGYEK